MSRVVKDAHCGCSTDSGLEPARNCELGSAGPGHPQLTLGVTDGTVDIDRLVAIVHQDNDRDILFDSVDMGSPSDRKS